MVFFQITKKVVIRKISTDFAALATVINFGLKCEIYGTCPIQIILSGRTTATTTTTTTTTTPTTTPIPPKQLSHLSVNVRLTDLTFVEDLSDKFTPLYKKLKADLIDTVYNCTRSHNAGKTFPI